MIPDSIFQILMYCVPALIVFLTDYLLITSFFKNETQKRHYDIRAANQKYTLPIRLQAYERLTLFLERISPNNIIPRIRKPEMSARDLQLAVLTAIRNEYEHNLSQQIYVSPEAWGIVTSVKEEIISIINRAGSSLPMDASNADLSRKIFEYFINTEQALPSQKALDILKAEVRRIY